MREGAVGVGEVEWARARELDASDPLAAARDQFGETPGDSVYLDGNSLGMLPRRSVARLRQVVEEEWGRGLVGSWDRWIDLPFQVGDRLGQALLGADAGEVVMADSTSVNLYKLAAAAVGARPGRTVVVTDRRNFPTDRYLLEGLVRGRPLELRLVEFDEVEGPTAERVRAAVDGDTALLSLSHVDYRSGAIADMAGISAVAHAAGALTLWDLSHSVGAVPIQLDRSGADLAAGCTYKYVNAGPGAPAFLYVRRSLQEEISQPIWGWFGKRQMFAMDEGYRPRDGVGSFLSGTPAVLGLALVEEGVLLLEELGIERIRAKSIALTSYLVELCDRHLAGLGFELASPRAADRRGSQVCLRHVRAQAICRELGERWGVVADFRAPDRLRLGCAAPTTSFADLALAVERIAQVSDLGEGPSSPSPAGGAAGATERG